MHKVMHLLPTYFLSFQFALSSSVSVLQSAHLARVSFLVPAFRKELILDLELKQ